MAITQKLKQISMPGLRHWKEESKSFKNSAINCLPVLFFSLLDARNLSLHICGFRQ